MNHRKSSMGKSRDFGISGVNGKGSADRVTDTAAYAANYDAINWGRAKINPAWVNAPVGIDETVPPYACLDTGPAPEHGDFKIWDR